MPPVVDTGLVISHRTTAGLAPENTLAGIVKARALGCAWVEVDVKLTADGVAVLFHDETLERTTNGTGAVAETPIAAIRSLDAGGWFSSDFSSEQVPTLIGALDLAQDLGLGMNVEIKPCPGREAETAYAVLDILADWNAERLLISSFDVSALGLAHDLVDDIPRALLSRKWNEKLISTALALDCEALHILEGELNRNNIAALKEAGLGVRAFTVNDPARAASLFGLGVDTVFSDFPDRVRA